MRASSPMNREMLMEYISFPRGIYDKSSILETSIVEIGEEIHSMVRVLLFTVPEREYYNF